MFTVDGTVGSLIDPVSLTSGTAAPPPPSRTTTFNPSIYEKSMVVSALVMIGGVRQTEGALVALVGQQMRGTQATPSEPPCGPYVGARVHQMIAYANTVGEKVTFHFSGRSGTFELAESLKFVEDGSTGSVADSFILSALASPPPPADGEF